MSKPNILQNADICLLDWSGTFSDDTAPVYLANQVLLQRYGETMLTKQEWRDGRPGWNASNFISREQGIDAANYMPNSPVC